MHGSKRVFKDYDYIEVGILEEIEITVGEWYQIDIAQHKFERIYRVTYDDFPEEAQIAIAEIISPQQIIIVSSAMPGSDWIGKKIKCQATIHGLQYYDSEPRILVVPPFWYFLLMETARLVNNGENNLAIITSSIAFESFLSEFVTVKLHKSEAWLGLKDDQEINRFKDRFIVGPDKLRLNEKFKLFINAWLGLEETNDTFQNWDSKVRRKRNALVHAQTNRQYGNKDAVEAFQASCCLIQEILGLDNDEELLKYGYVDNLDQWIEAAGHRLEELKES